MNNLPGQTQQPQPPKEAQSSNSPPTSQPPVSQPPIVQTVQSQEPSGKKKAITKIFAALAIFLVVVLVSEVANYFFTTKRQEEGKQPTTIPQNTLSVLTFSKPAIFFRIPKVFLLYLSSYGVLKTRLKLSKVEVALGLSGA